MIGSMPKRLKMFRRSIRSWRVGAALTTTLMNTMAAQRRVISVAPRILTRSPKRVYVASIVFLGMKRVR